MAPLDFIGPQRTSRILADGWFVAAVGRLIHVVPTPSNLRFVFSLGKDVFTLPIDCCKSKTYFVVTYWHFPQYQFCTILVFSIFALKVGFTRPQISQQWDEVKTLGGSYITFFTYLNGDSSPLADKISPWSPKYMAKPCSGFQASPEK